MARYSVAWNKAGLTSAGWLIQMRAASTAKTIQVYEVGMFLTAGGTPTASDFSLSQSATVGSTFTSTTPTADDPIAGAATARLDTAITSAPTQGAVLRRIGLAASIGAGVIWTFPKGLGLVQSGGLLLWQNSTANTADTFSGYFVYEE